MCVLYTDVCRSIIILFDVFFFVAKGCAMCQDVDVSKCILYIKMN